MSMGRAAHLLRKKILFALIQEVKRDDCARCGQKILTPDDLSIEHLQPWLHVDPALFWDLDNIAFSHRRCNTTDRYHRRAIPEGLAWCAAHRAFVPEEEVRCRSDGIRYSYCNECQAKRNRRLEHEHPKTPCPQCGQRMRKVCTACGFRLPMRDYMRLRRSEGATY